LYPDKKFTNVELEEVELIQKESCWMITLSYNEASPTALFISPAKKYKQFKIHSNTGEVMAMKIRVVS